MRNNIDEHSSAGTHVSRPTDFEDTISAPIEFGVLGEMVEPLARAVETGGDIVAAIIANATVRLSRHWLVVSVTVAAAAIEVRRLLQWYV